MTEIMSRLSREGDARPGRLRRWVIRIGVAFLVLEVAYLIAGNLCIRMGLIESAFNSQPEADFISWESGVTYIPGLFSFEGFA